MIIDYIRNANMYTCLGERMEIALKYLQENDFSHFEPGKYMIEGNNVFALVQQYETRLMENMQWEGHRKYIDIHYVVEGVERIGYALLEDMKVIHEYSEESDGFSAEGDGIFLTMKCGMFIILTPDDIHMPGIVVDKPQLIKKVVMKILI